MSEIIDKLGFEGLMGLAGMMVGVIAILGGCTVAVTKVISSNRRRMQQDEMDATLKMEMIQRGMSAEEIAAVLKARSSAAKNVNLNFNGLASNAGLRELAGQRERA